ncbi:MAG: hypothetical protein IBX57_00530 [Gammaproteobacteria bacterium]|nr:hypothetical protein [Gammaproteobacteria bacterium]
MTKHNDSYTSPTSYKDNDITGSIFLVGAGDKRMTLVPDGKNSCIVLEHETGISDK